MKKLLVTALSIFFVITSYADAGEKKIERMKAELIGAWKIEKVKKVSDYATIRLKKYTRDGGDKKAFITSYIGVEYTFMEDLTLKLKNPNTGKEYIGSWNLYEASVRSGDGYMWVARIVIEFDDKAATKYEDDSFLYKISKAGKFSWADSKYRFYFKKLTE